MLLLIQLDARTRDTNHISHLLIHFIYFVPNCFINVIFVSQRFPCLHLDLFVCHSDKPFYSLDFSVTFAFTYNRKYVIEIVNNYAL